MRCAPRRNEGVHVLNPESIRNTSFSLMPTGYNPEQVDDVLNAIAERLVGGEDIFDLVGQASFEVADVGYAQGEVDHFFAELSEGAAAQPVEEEVDDEIAADETSPAVEVSVEESDVEGEAVDAESADDGQPE